MQISTCLFFSRAFCFTSCFCSEKDNTVIEQDYSECRCCSRHKTNNDGHPPRIVPKLHFSYNSSMDPRQSKTSFHTAFLLDFYVCLQNHATQVRALHAGTFSEVLVLVYVPFTHEAIYMCTQVANSRSVSDINLFPAT